MKTAIILGATGLTGGMLLNRLLKDDSYSVIKLFSRSTTGSSDPKIEEHLIDLFELEKYEEQFTGDEVFCCIGTTKAKTPDEKTYHKIDYGIPVTAARLAKRNGIEKFLVISALGADANSSIFYNRTKGEMERDVLKENIPETYIFEPSLIAGERKEKRFFEALAKHLMKIGNYLLVGSLKKYRSIHPDTIARAMQIVAAEGYKNCKIESDEIKAIANHDRN
ncbi:NAD dependent epimerase/dehydratase family protein [Salinimicrobium catena]|uniref:NAD dependent epimerase/dehydratase family protein n=1 Tax=Salinimicrobium catena TaxID=390640 RepID=A0A1H5IYJ6_9FLAO|nr:NAD(P)H-binding protein [Salinimicrobium catena]SDK82167.1 NAD dependent epimerase/dehydratase family protein [Salinimicrobium catena]SEE45306.1 NAD dependent epimerase/dehydratase family protein [Salinimicrobium catena]